MLLLPTLPNTLDSRTLLTGTGTDIFDFFLLTPPPSNIAIRRFTTHASFDTCLPFCKSLCLSNLCSSLGCASYHLCKKETTTQPAPTFAFRILAIAYHHCEALRNACPTLSTCLSAHMIMYEGKITGDSLLPLWLSWPRNRLQVVAFR